LDGQKEKAGTSTTLGSGSTAGRDRQDDKFVKVDDFARKINKVTASQDDDSVVGNEKHRVVCKKHKKIEKSQGLGMTILFKQLNLCPGINLSSRPERSVVEGPAVALSPRSDAFL
jgi:hypothetical protein